MIVEKFIKGKKKTARFTPLIAQLLKLSNAEVVAILRLLVFFFHGLKFGRNK
jgi:hypothetical protein